MTIAHRVFLASVAVLLLATLLLSGSAVAAPKSYRIDLPTRTFTPEDDGGATLFERSAVTAISVLLQFRDHPNVAQKHALGNAGDSL